MKKTALAAAVIATAAIALAGCAGRYYDDRDYRDRYYNDRYTPTPHGGLEYDRGRADDPYYADPPERVRTPYRDDRDRY